MEKSFALVGLVGLVGLGRRRSISMLPDLPGGDVPGGKEGAVLASWQSMRCAFIS